MARQTKTLLRALDQLLATEATWTQHTNARDETGLPVPSNSLGAVRWCLLGALGHVGSPSVVEYARLTHVICATTHRLFGTSVVDANDKLGFGAVRRIIATAQGETK